MTGAENLMNTIINSLSMIDKGFTVMLTVQPHDWDYDGDDYEEEDGDEDEPHVSDEAIERIKEFSRVIDKGVPESIRDVYDHIIREIGDDLDDMPKSNAAKWPKVGDEVWYKTRHGNHEHGKVKVVCHNTIQLDNNVTLERKDCMKVPFEIGDEVYFDWCGRIKHGVIVENYSFDNVKVRCGNNTYCTRYGALFDSVDELLGYLKSTADE